MHVQTLQGHRQPPQVPKRSQCDTSAQVKQSVIWHSQDAILVPRSSNNVQRRWSSSVAAFQHLPAMLSADHAPPDVLPHVLLGLGDVWQAAAGDAAAETATSSSTSSESLQHDEQPVLCVPRTQARLQGMQLPGFIPRARGSTQDPQLALLRQQTLHAWDAATAWAQLRQRQQLLPLQQQQGEQQQQEGWLPDWLQQSLGPDKHWAPLAAMLHAAASCLQVSHLVAIIGALSNLANAVNSSSSKSGSRIDGTSSTNDSEDSSSAGSTYNGISATYADVLWPSVLLVRINASSSSDGIATESSKRADAVLTFKCNTLLPQISSLLQQQLQQLGQPPDNTNIDPKSSSLDAASTGTSSTDSKHTRTGSSQQTANLDTPAVVKLIWQLAAIHRSGRFGSAHAATVGSLVGLVELQQCKLEELAALISSCVTLGHPLHAAWLVEFTAAAVGKLQGLTGSADTAGSGEQQETFSSAAAGGGGDVVPGWVTAIASLLDGVSRYPGPHIQPEHLAAFVAATQPWLSWYSPAQFHQLVIAAAEMELPLSSEWLAKAAAVARNKLAVSSLQELLLLLQGVAAAGCDLVESWWQQWFEASAGRCAAISLAAPLSMQPSAAAEDSGGVSATANDSGGAAAGWTGSVLSAHDGDEFFNVLGWEDAQLGAASLQEVEQLPAALVCNLCELLLQLQKQVHPLWLAGLLEAHHRSAPDAHRAPQVLLLLSKLLPDPPGFAVRHRVLLNRIMQPLRNHLSELGADHLTQAAEVCRVYNIKLGMEWFRWHAAAVLRMGKTYPLEGLAKVREAYIALQVAPEERMQQLLDTVPWRLQAKQVRIKQQKQLAQRKAVITQKNEQRRLQNERNETARANKQQQGNRKDGGAAAAARPAGKQDWRKRKLKPPGTLERKF